MIWKGVIPHYREYLPVTTETPIITLKEGNTPLIEAINLNEAIGNDLRIHLKYEGLNPTSSFKDRGMTVAISKSVEEGAPSGDVCLNRQHVGVCCCLRCQSEIEMYCPSSKRRNCPWEISTSIDARCKGACG